MTVRGATLAKVIRDFTEVRLSAVHTAMPARVVAVNIQAQTVDVQPLLMRVEIDDEGNESTVSQPQVSSVPLLMPRCATAFISMPVAVDDVVLLVCAERSIDRWYMQGGEVDPGDTAMHDLSDAFAIPGVFPQAQALTDAHAQDIVIGFNGGGNVRVKPNGEVHLGQENPSDFVALATATHDAIDALRTTVNSLVTAYNTHTHLVSTTGTAAAQTGTAAPTTGTATAPAAVAQVAATKVKAL